MNPSESIWLTVWEYLGSKVVVLLGMVIPPLIGILIMDIYIYLNPYYWVDEFIPYSMEMSWDVIRPD